ncbi:MAG: FxsA family protein [bacterium]|nr:FxsA family protein [bacterium]
MVWKLILAFTVVPVIELYILMKLSVIIGAEYTILIILITGISGGILAKSQGINALKKIRTEISTGNIPTEELMDGVLILAGGLLLLTPGIITDITGFLLLIPVTRKPLKEFIKKRIKKVIEKNSITIDYSE